MNTKFIEARDHVIKARDALRRGDKGSARHLGEQAALLVPEMEDAWLVLAASDPNPQDSLAYAHKALEINPESTRARKGVDWALGRVKQAQARQEPVPVAGNPRMTAEGMSQNQAVTHFPLRLPQRSNAQPEPGSKKRGWVYAAAGIALLTCAVLGFAAWSAVRSPVFASILPLRGAAPASTQESLWAPVDIAKPSITPIDVSAFAPPVSAKAAPTDIPPTAIPTDVPTLPPTDLPTSIPTEEPTLIPAATETPGTLAMEIIADTPTSQYAAPADVQAQYPAQGNGKRWIDVNLSEQRVYAYEGDVIVNSFLASTGTARTPTVTGKFKIWIKLRSTTMSGPGYHLTNVPYTMYFYKGYGLHGTYWHNNFGTPMSHGCVNLATPDAAWLYNWALEGTVVNVHY